MTSTTKVVFGKLSKPNLMDFSDLVQQHIVLLLIDS
jgi:hypothetical protein